MLSTTLGEADRIKLGVNEGSELCSSYVFFDGSSGGNLESSLLGDSLGSEFGPELGSFVGNLRGN